MSSAASGSPIESASPGRFPRAATALALVALGAGISLHLRASQVTHWWLPLALMAVAHGAIISALVWLLARHRRRPLGAPVLAAEGGESHHPGEQGQVIRTPRRYDWLVRALTLGGEKTFRRRTLDLAELQPGETVLDVGCGTGTLLIEAAERVGAAGAVSGLEPSAEMVAHARRKAAAQHVRAEFLEGSADRLPFADASFDVVFCTLVLHHLPAPMRAVAIGEMTRVVRPGGRIVIVDLKAPETLSSALSLITLFHRVGAHGAGPDWRKIEALLTEHGATSIHTRPMWGSAVGAIIARRSPTESPSSAWTARRP